MLFYNIFMALTEWPVTYGGEIMHSLTVHVPYSKEALTKQSPPNQDTNNVPAAQDGQPNDGTAGGAEKE